MVVQINYHDGDVIRTATVPVQVLEIAGRIYAKYKDILKDSELSKIEFTI